MKSECFPGGSSDPNGEMTAEMTQYHTEFSHSKMTGQGLYGGEGGGTLAKRISGA